MKHLLFIYFLFFPLLSNAYDFEIEGNYYTLISTSDKTVAFSGTTLHGDIVIPSFVTFAGRTFSVSDISEFAFKANDDINSVSIPETITELNKFALGYGEFKYVYLPKTLKSIQDHAFSHCLNLKEINIPDNVERIGSFAFEKCTSLERIKLPKNLNKLGAAAFNRGPKPTGCLIIPGETEFKRYDTYDTYHTSPYIVFDNCSQLDSLIFEDGPALDLYKGYVESSYCNEFNELRHLKYIYIGRNYIKNWGSYIYAKKVVYGDNCSTQSNYFNNIYTDFTDSNNTEILEEIVFGKKIAKICSYKVNNKLRNVYVRSASPPTAEGFSSSTYIYGTLYVPKGTFDAYQNADVWKEFWNIEEYDIDTSIDTPYCTKNSDRSASKVYDINGQQLIRPQKGINIVTYPNGKKRKIVISK